MKLSWTRLKISIAGAKLSHLVQKDRIWDHGSMAEQARIIFYLVYKARANGNIETLKKQCTFSCFDKLKVEMLENAEKKNSFIMNPIIKEMAIIDVQPGNNNKPDMFCALIKWEHKDESLKKYQVKCDFVRQGDWWFLNRLRK